MSSNLDVLDRMIAERQERERQAKAAKQAEAERETRPGANRKRSTASRTEQAATEDICSRIDLLSLAIADTGENPEISGGIAYFRGECPICGGHDDFRVYPDSNSWACYSERSAHLRNPGKDFFGGSSCGYLIYARHGGDYVAGMTEAHELSGIPYATESKPQDSGRANTQNAMSAQLYANADPRPAINEPVRTLAELLPLVNRNRPEVIEGLLFDGGEMILQAPPKTGKSTAELWLAACMASGHEWFGHRVRRCATLYINTEGELDDYGNALADLMEHMEGIDPNLIHVWDISGKTSPLDLLESALVAKANAIDNLGIILLDSVFPVITGDENSNTDMSYFTNVLQRIRLESGVALVFCHHTSKGAQQYAETMYRSSGAGVWARHPTTILDVSPVKVKPAIRAARRNIEQCREIDRFLADIDSPLAFPDDVRKVADDYRRACVDALDPNDMNKLIAQLDAVEKRVNGCKAVRLTATRRGAQEPPPTAYFYDYPLFVPDTDRLLARESDDDGTSKLSQAELAEKRHAAIVEAIGEAVTSCLSDNITPTRANVLERIGEVNGKQVSKEQLKTWTLPSTVWSPWRVDGSTYTLYRAE